MSKLPRYGAKYHPQQAVKLVRAGHEFFDLLDQLIEQAQHTIHLQTYILADDETGRRVVNALIRAAKRNVSVYVIADGYASQDLSDEFIQNLSAHGIYFRFFGSLLKSKYFYFGRRLHHKVFVVDGKHSLVGGINIGDHYNDTTLNVAWLDWAVYTVGPISNTLERICEARVRTTRKHSQHKKAADDVIEDDKNAFQVRLRINDWVRRKREITSSYLEMLRHANSHITLISSYFIPGNIMRKYLAKASARGVKIRVIVAGISDVPVAKNAERFMYRWLLRNNIEIYEYQPKVLHAKLTTYDGKWVSVGSYNFNNISEYASVELNLDIQHEGFAKDVEARIARIIKNDCIQITESMYHQNQNLWNRFIQRSCYDIFRFLLFVFTFYFKQRD